VAEGDAVARGSEPTIKRVNVENATSDDSVAIDEDLVAALGFEPAADILIVDDGANDSLSISSDDIQVTTDSSDSKAADAKPSSPLGSGPPGLKNNRRKSKNKPKVKIHKAKPVKLEDKLAAESKAETELAAAAKGSAEKTQTTAKADERTESEAKPKTEVKGEAKPPKPQTKKTDAEPVKSDKADRISDSGAKAKMPPPPIAANAMLLSQPSTPDYSFADLQMPDFKGALARFTRNAPEEDNSSNGSSPGVGIVAEAPDTTVIDTRVADAPAIVTSPPAVAPPVAPQPQIVQAPAEPNVYMAPKRSGRTRIRSRKVRRQIRHIDPWSVLTFSVIFHACVFGALLLASVLVWGFADGAGVIENVEKLWGELADQPDFQIDENVLIRAAAMIAGLLAIASSVLLVLLTVFFNLISDLVGGIRVTVIEEEPIRTIK
jgi:hypothetical protein